MTFPSPVSVSNVYVKVDSTAAAPFNIGRFGLGVTFDGRTTAADLGMEKLINANKWCIGKPLLARGALTAADRWQLVGLSTLDGTSIPRGAKP